MGIGIGLSEAFGSYAPAISYSQKLQGIQPADLIAYWKLTEKSGTTAVNAEGTAARNGTYARNVTAMGTVDGIGDGNTAPDFDGTNDEINVYSADLSGAIDGDEGTLAGFLKAENANVWSDDLSGLGLTLGKDASNELAFRHWGNNTVQVVRKAGGVTSNIAKGSVSTIAWFHMTITWSKTADQVIAYFDGVQFGAPATGLGAFGSPSLVDGRCYIGNNPSGNALWIGALAHFAIWTKALTGAEVASLASPF
jgi:hypothetical protein